MGCAYNTKKEIELIKSKDINLDFDTILHENQTTIYNNISLIEKKKDLKGKKVLEIGCGIGRWAQFFNDKCSSYLGLDYSENLVEIAKQSNKYDNCKFQVMSAFDIKIDELLVEPPFDIILISQVLMYINDEEVSVIIDEINEVIAEDKQVFITEPISCTESRLTLKDFYSDDLEADYNAIYRTENEYREFFKKLNCNEINSYDIFMESNEHAETQYKSFVMK
jgi:2-polyprenyl-3-methyl-5-hydroxy-6-metoxy-1,4-benzoquinol methylase